jgi:hypothetical protein
MDIAKKLQTIAENQQRVFEAGKSSGGGGGEPDASYGIKELIKIKGAKGLFSNSTVTNEQASRLLKFDTTEGVTNFSEMFSMTKVLTCAPLFDTRSCTNASAKFYYMSQYKKVEAYDMRNCTNLTNAFHLDTQLSEIWIKNIKAAFTVNYCPLTKENIIHLIKECRDTGSSLTLTLGNGNLAKITGNNAVYVKTVEITDEMIAEDDLIGEKLPFVVCESTDEGATPITEYVKQKNWNIAG